MVVEAVEPTVARSPWLLEELASSKVVAGDPCVLGGGYRWHPEERAAYQCGSNRVFQKCAASAAPFSKLPVVRPRRSCREDLEDSTGQELGIPCPPLGCFDRHALVLLAPFLKKLGFRRYRVHCDKTDSGCDWKFLFL